VSFYYYSLLLTIRVCSQTSAAEAELDKEWIHPLIGLDWMGLDWVRISRGNFSDWFGSGKMDPAGPNLGRGTMTTQSSENGATTLSCTNFTRYAGHVTISS